MWKMVITNSIIPIFSLAFTILEDTKINGERTLSIKYRLWMFDYGIFLIVAQLIVLVVTFFVWKKKKFKLIAIAIFLIWIVMGILMPEGPGLFD